MRFKRLFLILLLLPLSLVAQIGNPSPGSTIIGPSGLTAAAVNGVLTTSPSGEVSVIPATPTGTTNLSDTVISLNKGNHLFLFGNGIYSVLGITVPDSLTDTSGQSIIDCPDHARIQLAAGSNRNIIQDTNFYSLTGTGNQFGTFKFTLRGCTLDGNKANQAALVTTGTCVPLNVTRTAGGLVTINCANTPSPAFAFQQAVDIAGVATDGFTFNGHFIVQSATATSFTFNENQCLIALACHTTALTTQPVAIAITGCTASGFTATCNTGSAHGFVPLQNVTMSGLTPSGYNGTYLLVTASGTSFTFVVPTSGLGASGAGTATPVITAIGYGGSGAIKIYGRRSIMADDVFANNVCDGRWDEGVTPTTFTNDTSQLVSTYTDLQEMNSGCDGWVFWGPQSSVGTNVDDFNHGHFGLEAFQTLWLKGGTTFLNGFGGIHNFSADLQLTNRQEASATGWGILTEPQAAQMTFAGGSVSAPIGVEFRNPGNTFHGQCLNSTTCFKFNGGSVNAQVSIFTVTTWFDCTNENALVVLDVSYGSTGGTMQGTNCWTGQEMLRLPITAGNATNAQFPASLTGFHIGGWNPQFQAANGLLLENANHLVSATPALSASNLSGCGTGPTLTGTDSAGTIVVGTAAGTTCTLTFNSAWLTAPTCVVSDDSAIVSIQPTSTTTQLVLTGSAALTSAKLTYICIGVS